VIQNVLEIVGSLGELNTVILLIALVVMFVVAFKVLEMVMQTLLVSALSGGFYLAITYYLESVSFSLDSLLFFTLIGGSLYTFYSLLTTSASLLKLLVKYPVKLAKGLIGLVNDKRSGDKLSED